MLADDTPDDIGNLGGRTLAGTARADVEVHRDQVGTVALHGGECVVGIGLSEGSVDDLRLRNGSLYLVIDRIVEPARHTLGRTHREFDGHGKTVGISTREVLGLEPRSKQHNGQHERGCEAEYHGLAALCGPVDHMRVASGYLVQEAVDRDEYGIVGLAVLHVRLKPA